MSGAYFAVRCGDGGNRRTPTWSNSYSKKVNSRYPLAGPAIIRARSAEVRPEAQQRHELRLVCSML